MEMRTLSRRRSAFWGIRQGAKYAGALISFIFLYVTPAPAATDPTVTLLELCEQRKVALNPVIIGSLLDAGAQINGRNESHSTPLILAIESFAYQSTEKDLVALLPATRQAIDLLLDRGADLSLADGRGVTALAYLVNYADPSRSEPLIEALLARKPDLSAAGEDDGHVFIHFLARSQNAFQWVLDRVLTDPHAYRIDLGARAKAGYSVLHFAATRLPSASGPLRLRQIADRLPPELRKRLIDAPDETGSAPLAWAVLARNHAAVEFLLSEPSVDANRVNTEGETPLDVAAHLGDSAILALLQKKGARAAPRRMKPQGSGCQASDDPSLGISGLRDLLGRCQAQVHTLDDLLPLLPRSLRSNYVLMYSSQSLQQATFENPRAILFQRDGGLILSFNGDPTKVGFRSLEVMAQNPATKQLELYDFDFSEAATKGVKVTGPNSRRCTVCHTNSPRLHWDSWTGWRGAYHGDMLNLYPTEKSYYDRFLAAKDAHPRYRHLLPPSAQPLDLPFGPTDVFVPGVTHQFANFRFDSVIESLMGLKIAHELRDPRLRPFRYAILGALSCASQQFAPESFLPSEAVLPARRSFADVRVKTLRTAREFTEQYFRDQDSRIPGGFVGRYNREARTAFARDLQSPGVNLETSRVSALRFMIEGVLGDGAIGHWGTFFTGPANYVFTTLSHVEAFAWKELLDPVTDAELWSLYGTEWAKLRGQDRVFYWIYASDKALVAPLCETLRKKSLEALQILPSSPATRR